MTTELVLFVGLQASGKSSFYRARFAGTHDLVSKDRFPNNRNPARRQRAADRGGTRRGPVGRGGQHQPHRRRSGPS